jgi:hypothetical protein
MSTIDTVAFRHRHVEEIAIQAEGLRSVIDDHQGAEARKRAGKRDRAVVNRRGCGALGAAISIPLLAGAADRRAGHANRTLRGQSS